MKATRMCGIDGCERPCANRRRSFCSTHYSRWHRTGAPGSALILNGKQGCVIADCDRPHSGLGYCHLHWQRLKRYGDPLHVPDRRPPPQGFGPESPNWKGDAAGYAAVHYRVRRERGRASSHACDHCGRPAREWAYDHKDPNERRSRSAPQQRDEGPYSLDLVHYLPLCFSCHRKLDRSY